MEILRSYDVEDEVRKALAPYFKIYVRPLPVTFDLPSLLVTQVGGDDENTVDGTDIVIDCRARTNLEAIDTLLDAIGALKAIARSQETNLRYVEINTSAQWSNDPVRPELAMCSARLRIYTHQYNKEINSLT